MSKALRKFCKPEYCSKISSISACAHAGPLTTVETNTVSVMTSCKRWEHGCACFAHKVHCPVLECAVWSSQATLELEQQHSGVLGRL